MIFEDLKQYDKDAKRDYHLVTEESTVRPGSISMKMKNACIPLRIQGSISWIADVRSDIPHVDEIESSGMSIQSVLVAVKISGVWMLYARLVLHFELVCEL